MILLHGTTRWRAEQIVLNGPDVWFQEPGEVASRQKRPEFTMNLESGPFWFGHPEDYARLKALQFPTEGGAVILALQVPEEIVRKATDGALPLSQGVVQFEPGLGLDALLREWPTVAKSAEIRGVE
jgi:hypothetical protein